jgi:hypothetical protein
MSVLISKLYYKIVYTENSNVNLYKLEGRMKKQLILLWTNILAFLLLLSTIILGFCLGSALEYAHSLSLPGTQMDAVIYYGLSLGTWEILHVTSAFIFVAMIALHLILNFNWIKAIPNLLSQSRSD